MEKFVIIDGNSLINRAFYALPMLRSLSGKPCNAVYGFVNMLLNVITSEKPKHFACAFDAGKHTFRHNMYAEYKGKRDKMPEDLAEQLPILKELLTSMGIKIIEQAEIEADDIIGSLTRKFDEQFILVSGDKDLLQLINDNTTVWLTQKGISNVLKVNRDVLKQEFNLRPEQVIDLKAIMGDSSDNIPGVAGIGKVGANKLIDEYDNLDNIYQNIDKITGSTQKKLIENKEMAYLSYKLATIKLDVDIDCRLEDFEYKFPFDKQAYDLMKELDFKSILNRKELFDLSNDDSLSHLVHAKNATVIEINSDQDFEDFLNVIPDSFAVLSDNLTINIAFDDKEYILYKNGEIFSNNLSKIQKIFNGNKQKICFDAKELMHEFDYYNIQINNYFDVSLAIYIANEMDGEISLDDA